MSLANKQEVEEENGEEADGEEEDVDGEEENVGGEEEDVEVSGEEGGNNTIVVSDYQMMREQSLMEVSR